MRVAHFCSGRCTKSVKEQNSSAGQETGFQKGQESWKAVAVWARRLKMARFFLLKDDVDGRDLSWCTSRFFSFFVVDGKIL